MDPQNPPRNPRNPRNPGITATPPRPTYTAPMDRLIASLSRLPGIGKRSAERVAFHLLKAPASESQQLADALVQMKATSRHCSRCFNLTDADPCAICADERRDHGVILVVEQPADVVSLEATGMYHGVYHVLMGRLAPLEDVGPGDLNVQPLLARVQKSNGSTVREVILGTNPTLEGDGTALYLAQELGKLGVKVSRLARGLPTGANLEYLSKAVLADAIQGRQDMGTP